MSGARVLVVEGSPGVLETVLDDLAGLGVEAVGTAHPRTAPQDFDARDFALVAIGGETGGQRALGQAFAALNPSVRLMDLAATDAARRILLALEDGPPDSGIDLEAYLARIAHDGSRRPDLDTLTAIHARHIDSIAFEGIDAWLGRGIDLAPAAVEAKLIGARRGGYCFEQSGLMKRALEALGFAVEGLGARVRFGLAPGECPGGRTHMALKVTVNGIPWLVDAGFGRTTPAVPLRLDTPEPQPTPHETCRIIPFGSDHLLQQQGEDGRWQSLYQIVADRPSESDYAMANWFTSTHPSSVFRQALVAARTTADARYGLLNGRLTVRRVGRPAESVALDADGLGEVLAGHFGLPVDPSWRDELARAAAAGLPD